MDSPTRAGSYEAQPGGYRAFVPAPLPPDPPLQIDLDLLGWISKADRALGRLDGATGNLPNPDLFVFMYVRKEAVHSSQIAGTQASLLDVLADLERFIHADEGMPVLFKVGPVHAQFETIHPFLDGNGRVGRLLITLLLCAQGALKRPLLYLSYYFSNATAASTTSACSAFETRAPGRRGCASSCAGSTRSPRRRPTRRAASSRCARPTGT